MELTDTTRAQLQDRIDALRHQLSHLENQLATSEAMSRERATQFDALFKHSHDSILVVDSARDCILDANDNACAMLEYTREELVGMPLAALHPHELAELERFAKIVEERGYDFTDHLSCRTKTGRRLSAEIAATALHECCDGPRLLVTIRNVTERKQVQNALQHTESLFRAVFEAAPVAIGIADAAGNLQRINHGFEQIFGYTQAEIQAGMRLPDLAGPEPTANGHQMVKEILRGERDSFRAEKQFVRKDGHLIWAHIAVYGLRDDHGAVQNIIVIFEDITEHRRAIEALRASEERYRTISRMTSDYVHSAAVTSRGTLILEWATDGLPKLTGYEADELELVGGWQAIVHPDDRDSWCAWRDDCLRHGRASALEYRIHDKAGDVRWLRDHWRPRWDDREDRVTHILAATSDISIHRQADMERERLLTEMRRQTAIIENTSDFVGISDMSGRMLYVNPAGMAMVGRAGATYSDLSPADFLSPESARRLDTEIVPELTGGRGVWQGELMFQHREGHSIPTTQAIMLVRDQTGAPFAVGAIVRDVTEVKRFERALEDARDRAEAANRAKSTFLASMSHELRTPLNAILGFSQLMVRDRGLTGEQKENLGIINRSGEHLLALINDVLEMSKIEAGRTALNVQGIDLHQLLGDIENMFTLRAAHKNLSMLFEREPEVPVYVRTDEGKLRQILINLISNAIKFTDRGGITVRVGVRLCAGRPRQGHSDHGANNNSANNNSANNNSANHNSANNNANDDTRERRAEPEMRIRFEVQDTGVGIEEHELHSLFEAFVQTRSGTDLQEGTGLGLPISREFVRMMGGDLEVKSQVGLGSIFTFHILVTPTSAAEVNVVHAQRRVVALLPDQPAYRILVVEDRAENRKLLTRLLRPLGFEVREVENGEQAIAVWQEWSPHLIWMDMRMPVMDGYQATQRIRAGEGGRDTVIIAITASAFEEDRALILSAGCDDFVRKPFRENEVYDKMSQHLGVRFQYNEPVPRESGLPGSFHGPGAGPDARALGASPNADAISDALRARLHQATMEADFDHIFTVIEEIRRDDSEVANTLSEMANGFRYDDILSFLQPSATDA